MRIRFSRRELRDFAIAWVALGVAFTAFYFNDAFRSLTAGVGTDAAVRQLVWGFGISMLTAGVGFLLHELAHKVVAVRYGQLAEFRADYGMLFLAVMAGFAGFLFAAPGAVHHRGRITPREQGLIALAGPATNVALVGAFGLVIVLGEATGVGLVGAVGLLGVLINALLAGFNMIPFGPLDGRKVLNWSRGAYVASAVPTVGLAAYVLFGGGLGLLAQFGGALAL